MTPKEVRVRLAALATAGRSTNPFVREYPLEEDRVIALAEGCISDYDEAGWTAPPWRDR